MKFPLDRKKAAFLGLGLFVVVLLIIVFVVKNTNSTAPQTDATTVVEEVVKETSDEQAAQPAPAISQPVKSTPAKTNTPVVVKAPASSCKPSLSISKNNQLRALVLKWNPCMNEDFQLYHIYRNNAVIEKSGNKNMANYVDKNLVNGTTYVYKVCVTQKLSPMSCSNSVSSVF